MKPSVVIVHFRKAGVKNDRPWTVHVRGSCIPAASVTFEVPSFTVFKPEKKTNPRAWIRAVGLVRVDAQGNAVVYKDELIRSAG